MPSTDDWGGVAVNQQPQPDNWGGIPIEQPKVPDVSGVQKMAQANLAANDNKSVDGKPPTPMEHLSTAAGIPVDKVINGTAQPTDINAANRVQYVKALDNGSATNSSDWMQTMFHAIAPVMERDFQKPNPLKSFLAGYVPTATEDLGISEENKEWLGKVGIYPVYGKYGNLLQSANEAVMTPLAAGADFLMRQPMAVAEGVATALEDTNTQLGYQLSKEARLAPNLMMEHGILPIHPQAIIDAVAAKTGKAKTSVTPSDINQITAQGSKDLQPSGDDFKTVAQATGIPEQGLKTVYADSGVTPEKVLTDAQHDPTIAADVAAGKVPEQYEHLVEQRQFPAEQAEKLHVSRDEATRSFSVVDADGDHVQGGFDSYEEAQQHIADKKFEAEERAAIEDEGKAKPTGGESKTIRLYRGEGGDLMNSKEGGEWFTPDIDKAKKYGKVSYLDVTPEEYKHLGRNADGHEDEIIIDDPSIRGRAKHVEETKSATEKTPAGEQAVIPGAEKISDKELAERKMQEPDRVAVEQKPANEGLFDVAGRSQQDMFTPKPKTTVPPSEFGKPTSLRTFLSNNGAKFNEANELVSIKRDGKKVTGVAALDHANDIAKEHGYLPKDDPNAPSKGSVELQNLISDKNGGREAFRDADMDRVLKAQEAKRARENLDPTRIEHEAHNLGIDTEKLAGETDKQHTDRLIKALKEVYADQEGGGITFRKAIGDTIIAVEKFAGKLTGDIFKQLADAYKATFQPELFGPIAKRADAYLAKFKASIQEAENALYRRDAAEIKRVDRLTDDQRREWLYDHETGRWNEEENPDHAAEAAIYESMRKSEQDAGVGTSNYKNNYLPHQFEKPDEVNAFFRSEPMIKKYGQDWFNKASEFRLIQEAERAGFKLKTNNYVRMRIARQLASDNMLRTMDLLNDLKGDGVAVRASAFSVDKRIAKTQKAISDLQEKYKAKLDAIQKQASMTDAEGKPIGEPVTKQMQSVQARLEDLKRRLDDFTKEKADIKQTPKQLKELKTGLRIIGPDSKAWNIHPQAAPIWHNAMEMKGMWDRQGALGDSYRIYMAGKAVYVRSKMLASLWHPTHEVVIDVSSGAASIVHHLIQGGKLSDLTARDIPGRIGLTGNTFKMQDHPKIVSWNTAPELRTPEQQADVQRMKEGGLVPTIPAQDAVRFRENFEKGINGIGVNNLRLLGTALELPSVPMAPLMEHWIPGMKVDSYFQRTDMALKRDPSLANDAGRRGEVFRQIAQDIERNYGEMNRNTQFWNPILKDIFNATTFSAGWKLAMLQNMRGLAEPAKIAYNFAKTGEFSKADITHQMLQSYIYTANMLTLGAGLTYMFTGAVGTIKDWINPPTGDKNPDGTPVRLRQPTFFNEPMMLMHDINQDGPVQGTGSFLYHQTLIPGIADTLMGRDFVGRPYITDPTDLQQWKNMGLDSINPIIMSNTQKAEQEGSKTAEHMGWVGFPIAGSWVNQTPFEQKVIGKYFEQNPSKDSAIQAKLKAEMQGAVISHDTKEQIDIAKEMKDEHMTDRQISFSKEKHTDKFSTFAWSKLSAEDQKRLIGSASEKEKQDYKIKSQ